MSLNRTGQKRKMSDPYTSLFETLAAKHLESRASILSLRVLLAELVAEKEGVDVDSILRRFEAHERKMHAQLLLEAEKDDPSGAAMLDKRSASDVARAEEDESS